MLTQDAAIENVARAFYELEGDCWDLLAEDVRDQVRARVKEILADPCRPVEIVPYVRVPRAETRAVELRRLPEVMKA